MKYTLLEMVQQILISLDGDAVNSIDDTPESSAVAYIIKECYYDLVGQLDLPEHFDFFALDATSVASPTVMTLPDDVITLQSVKYDERGSDETDRVYRDVHYMPIQEFTERFLTLDSDDTEVDQFSITTSGGTFYFKARNDNPPSYYTTYNDSTLIFDSYDSDVDTHLQTSKTLCYGLMAPTFTMSDTFTPDLDHRQFAALLNEAKAQCWNDLKQQANNRAENKARQNKIDSQKKKQNIGYPNNLNYYFEYPNYGRK